MSNQFTKSQVKQNLACLIYCLIDSSLQIVDHGNLRVGGGIVQFEGFSSIT